MRKKVIYHRPAITPDTKYHSLLVSKLINYVMRKGKKSLAQNIVYKAIEIAENKLKMDGLKIVETAIDNISPTVEVRSRRIGGATYQVPMEVRPARRTQLALRWITSSVRDKKGRPAYIKLSDEIISSYNGEGDAMHKRELMHKAAESNKAFAHLARY